MIIKERKFKECITCGHKEMIGDEEYGCDNCKRKIDLSENRSYLSASVFHHSGETSDNLHFCSWDCVLKKLKTIQTDYFISLPYLLFDETNPRINGMGFWDAIGKIR